MKMRFGLRLATLSAALLLGTNAFGLAADYPTNNLVQVSGSSWPKGFVELVNTTNRVHGFWVNSEDIFFFQGGAEEFNSFLRDYAKIGGIENHELVLHEGVGDAKSPWEKNSRACDWRLYGCPKGWLNLGELSKAGTNSVEALQAAAKDPNYVLKVDFWTGGKIPFDQVKVPENVKVVRETKTK